jgi:glycosyltransferase involved in cell wall biosynthesis
MKKNIKFSIIVVSLNTKNDFIKTINSILNQKYKYYEIIVVDGNSTDGTIQIINKLKNKLKKKIIERDRGIYHAMNKGIKYINSNLTVFLNSGDVLYNRNILNKINLVMQKHKEVDIIIGKNIVKSNFKYYSKFEKIHDLSFSSVFSHQSVFIKSKLFEKKKYDLRYKIAADFELFKFFYKKNKKFYYTNLTCSISKASGISDKNRLLALSEFYNISKKYTNNKQISFFLKYIFNFIYISLVNLIKLIIPKKITLLILKFKYRNHCL